MTERGDRRLEMARKIMHLDERLDVMTEINRLPKTKRDNLRGLVDWIEDHDKSERTNGIPIHGYTKG